MIFYELDLNGNLPIYPEKLRSLSKRVQKWDEISNGTEGYRTQVTQKNVNDISAK